MCSTRQDSRGRASNFVALLYCSIVAPWVHSLHVLCLEHTFGCTASAGNWAIMETNPQCGVRVKYKSDGDYCRIINNYWMRLSMISWTIKTEVCAICRSLHRREVLIIHGIKRKPNSIMVLLYIFHIIHPQKQKRSVQSFCFRGKHSKGLSNQVDVELDMIYAISAADIPFIMSSLQAIVNWLNALDQADFS